MGACYPRKLHALRLLLGPRKLAKNKLVVPKKKHINFKIWGGGGGVPGPPSLATFIPFLDYSYLSGKLRTDVNCYYSSIARGCDDDDKYMYSW